MGVNALTYSTILMLEELAIDNNLKFEYVLIGTGKYIETQDVVKVGNKEISIKYYPYTIISSKKRIITKYLKNLYGVDIVLDIGEGDSFTDIYGQARFNIQLKSKFLVLLLLKRLILLPQTIGPFNKKSNKFFAFLLMRFVHKIFVRDELSSKYLDTSSIIRKKTIKSLDMALYLPYKKQNFNEDKVQVGINISALLWNGGYNRDNDFGLVVDYKEIINDIIIYFKSLSNVKIHLIPHVITDFEIEDDLKICNEICQEFEGLILPTTFRSPIEAKSYISGLDFLIGSRMHACIAAYSSNVPLFFMGYSRKFEGLFVHTLQYDYGSSLYSEDKDKIMQKIDFCFHNRGQLLESIKNKSNMLIDNKYNIKNVLKSILTKK
jgi:polysaccharide pyruvyl transferase WcaK-like protein